MELSFVVAALRRRWWVILIFAELGVLPMLFGGPTVNTSYESRAEVEVRAGDDFRSAAGQPDRYIVSQLRVLESRALAEEVADKLGVEEPRDIQRSTTFEHLPDSDVVRISVRQPSGADGAPETAQEIAQTFATTYVENLTEAVNESRRPDLERYDAELDELQTRLTGVNARLEAAYAVWLARANEPGQQLPQLETIALDDFAEREFIIADINRVESLRSALRDRPTGVNSTIVQPATLPGAPVNEAGSLFEIAFLLAMTLLGITAALLWARFSPKVLDDVAAEEVIGAPVVSKIKKSKTLKQDPLVAFTRLPQELISSIDQVAVQAEALATIDQPLTIAVVGSQRGAGTTTTAVALAARFAAAEYSVLLVDADRRDPWITEVFGAGEHGGIPALLGTSEAGLQKIFTRTSEPDVRVLGLGRTGSILRREAAPHLVEASREAANIIIFDGGPLLDAASTVELCNTVDAIVLTVPLSMQRTDDLSSVTRQLAPVRNKVLPVSTNPTRGAASREPVASDLGADSVGSDGNLLPIAERRKVKRPEPTPSPVAKDKPAPEPKDGPKDGAGDASPSSSRSTSGRSENGRSTRKPARSNGNGSSEAKGSRSKPTPGGRRRPIDKQVSTEPATSSRSKE